MSLLGNDMSGTATINGLNNINSNNVFSDDVFIDYSTNPINIGDALMVLDLDVLGLQGQVSTLDGEVNILQSEMNTAQSEINTLQSEMNTAQSDINDLQADVIALGVSTGITAATVAGLVISQAAQDVTIAAQGVSITALQLEDISLDNRIDALEVKTSDQSWGSLSGTTFSTKTNVGTTSAGVVLNTSSASEFGSGIVCSSIASTSATTDINIGSALTTGDVNLGSSGGATGVALNWGGTSNSGQLTFRGGSFNLFSSGAFSATTGTANDANLFIAQAGGVINLGTLSNRSGGININTGVSSTAPVRIGNATTLNAPIFIGSAASTSQIVDIFGANLTIGGVGTTNLAVQSAPSSNILFGTDKTGGGIYFGMYNATASTNALFFNIGPLNTGSINFGTGASAKTITFGSSAATNNLIGTTTLNGITNINTTSLSNTNIGNGAAGGNFSVNAAANSITGTTNTLTSTGETEINSGILDINASGAITIDGATTTNITSVDDMTLQTTNPFGDLRIISAGTTTLTSTDETEINCSTLDINASGLITIDTLSGTTLTSGQAVSLTATTGNMSLITSSTSGDCNITTGRNINLTANTTGGIINCSSNKDQDILKVNNTAFDSKFLIGSETTGFRQTVNNNSYANLSALGATQLNLSTANANLSLTSTGGAVNINTIGSQQTNIGNGSGAVVFDGGSTIIKGNTTINTSGSLPTTIGSSTSSLTVNGATNINNNTTIVGTTDINTTGNAATNIGVATATSGDVFFRGQNVNFEAYSSVQIEATNGFWTNIGQSNFYFRAYNGLPNIIMGNQTTATDYLQIEATAIGSTISVYSAQPLTLSASQVNIPSANITNGSVELLSPLQMDAVYTTYPITNNFSIGRFISTTTTTKGTIANINLASLAIPRAGCYLVEGCFMWSGTGTAQAYTAIGLSITSAVFDNRRQQVFYQGGVSGGYGNNIQSVFNFTASGTVFFVMQVPTNVGAATVQNNYMSATRIA